MKSGLFLLLVFAVALSSGNLLGAVLGQVLNPTSNPNPSLPVDYFPTLHPQDETLSFDYAAYPEGPVEVNKMNMTPVEIIRYQGFPVETHHVITPDFYNNTYYRIPNPGKTPVYILHGILCTARDFLVQPGNSSLPFKLFNAGFDVWIGNIRGNSFSDDHLNYTTEEYNYWNFSNDEVMKYDNPTIIDYILENTGHSKLIWIGYSLGTYTFFGTMASLPAYNDKILQFVGLAPVTYIGNMTSPLHALALFADFSQFSGALDHGAFTPQYLMPLLNITLPVACFPGQNILDDVRTGACAAALSFLVGANGNETNKAVLPVAFNTFPNSISGNSIKQIIMDIKDPQFRMMDFGTLGNLGRYGSLLAPKYNVTKVTAPIILYSGISDSAVVIPDTDRTANDLPCYPRRRYVPFFNHLDFIYGRHAPQLYDYIVEDLLNVNTGQFSSPCTN